MTELERLNEDRNWRTIYGKPEPDPKQRDIELILRLLAFYKNLDNYSPPMKDFLSREMSENRHLDSERAKAFSEDFLWTVETIVETIESPFRPRGLLNAATLEAVMVALMEKGREKLFSKESYESLVADNEFLEAISSNTSSVDRVNSRRARAEEILFGDE